MAAPLRSKIFIRQRQDELNRTGIGFGKLTAHLIAVFACILLSYATAANAQSPDFKVVPLGVKGGIDESNLSSYALAIYGTEDYVCLDAGTIHSGIKKAIDAGVWKGDATTFQKANIKGYLISHPHLDHLAGMVINATDDTPKPIYATESCANIIAEKYFSWKNWANFTNEGDKPTLSKYTFVHLLPGTETLIQNTAMTATPFILSHGNPYQSTAFLIAHNDSYLLYLGDTGADEIEKSDKLSLLWKGVSKLIAAKKLKAIFIEVSYTNEQPSNLLFGHLTPKLLMNELKVLANIVGDENLKNLSIVITHMKPAGDREQTIRKQLEALNATGLHLRFPEQARQMEF